MMVVYGRSRQLLMYKRIHEHMFVYVHNIFEDLLLFTSKWLDLAGNSLIMTIRLKNDFKL